MKGGLDSETASQCGGLDSASTNSIGGMQSDSHATHDSSPYLQTDGGTGGATSSVPGFSQANLSTSSQGTVLQ